jgi:5-methylcytosine-specific restriction endonuclease McrA
MDPRYSSARWKRLRKAIRQRDRNECQIKLPGCRGIAQSVDHRIEPGPPSAGRDDLFWAAWNLQSACRSCNTAKRNKHRNELARQAEGGEPTFTTSRDW